MWLPSHEISELVLMTLWLRVDDSLESFGVQNFNVPLLHFYNAIVYKF